MSKTNSRVTPFLKQCFVTTAVCIDVIGHGNIIGYPAILLPQLAQRDAALPLSEEDASWIASVLGIAMMIGIFVTPPIMGRLGRKNAHYIVILALLLGWVLFTMASSVKLLIIARTLQGLSFGIFMTLRSILIGEYTSPRNRGAFLTAISLAQGFGLLLVHLIGSLLSWQRTALVCMAFPFASLIMTIYSPESPSWLADRGQYEKCREVFRWLRGEHEEAELEEMIQARLLVKKQDSLQGNRSILKSFTATIVKKEFYRPIIVMLHANFMMSFSGCVTLSSFAPTIISLTLGPKVDPQFWMVALDTQRLVSNTLAVYIVNKTKRRKMMFGTLGLCIFTHLAIAAYVYVKTKPLIHYDGLWIPIVLINLHYFTIAMGMVPLPSVIAGEIFPSAYRSIGGSISMVSYAGFMFLALKTFAEFIRHIGLHGTYTVYAGILIYNFVVIWFLMPETKGKTLQQIENEFKGLALVIEEVETRQCLQDPNTTLG